MPRFLLAKGIPIPSLLLNGTVLKSLSQDTRNIISFIKQEQMENQQLLPPGILNACPKVVSSDILKAFAAFSRYHPGILQPMLEWQVISHSRVPFYIRNEPVYPRRLSVIVGFDPLDPVGLETATASLSNQMSLDHQHVRLALVPYLSLGSFATS
jgi:hypothetical protein